MPEAQVVAQLKGSTALTALVGTRIYPIMARQVSSQPYVTYQRIATQHINASTGGSDVAFSILQLNCYAATYSGAKGVSAAVKASLANWSNTTGDPAIDMCHIQNESDLPDDPIPGTDKPIFAVTQDFLLQHGNT
jgi:hypothetical protein